MATLGSFMRQGGKTVGAGVEWRWVGAFRAARWPEKPIIVGFPPPRRAALKAPTHLHSTLAPTEKAQLFLQKPYQ